MKWPIGNVLVEGSAWGDVQLKQLDGGVAPVAMPKLYWIGLVSSLSFSLACWILKGLMLGSCFEINLIMNVVPLLERKNFNI